MKERAISEKPCSNVAKRVIGSVLGYANYRFRQTFYKKRVHSEDRCFLETDRHDTGGQAARRDRQIIILAMINDHFDDVKGTKVQGIKIAS